MVHPPTAFCLTRYLLHLLPFHSISMDARHDTLELSRFLTELGVMDYFFVLHRPSTIALAAILNALEEIPSVPHQTQSVLLSQIQHNTSLDVFSTDIDECRARLRLHYIQGGYARPSSTVQTNRNSAISPVSVTYGLNGYRQYVYTKTNEASEHHVY